MSDIPDGLRSEVARRADGCCEYCLMPIEGQIAWFPIDHITPRSRGGETVSSNLAMACSRCNAHKWAADSAVDPETRETVPLYNPRQQVWEEHFQWSGSAEFEIEGRTSCGRATARRLKMNDPEIVAIRRVLIDLGISFHYRD